MWDHKLLIRLKKIEWKIKKFAVLHYGREIKVGITQKEGAETLWMGEIVFVVLEPT